MNTTETQSGSSLQRMVSPRRPRQTPNRIAVKWASTPDEGADLYVSWGEGCYKADANLVIGEVNKLAQELAKRGYDITSIRFEVKRANDPASQGVRQT